MCLGAGCVGLLLGCAEDVASENVKTNGMYADLTVTGRADGQSEVRASILIGGRDSNTYAQLSAGDVLSATSGTEMKSLTEEGGSGGQVHVYHANFAGALANQEFTVSFDRAADESAPVSTTVLPDPFVISAPSAGTDVSRAAALTVTWSPTTSEGATISVDGDCVILDLATDATDTGTHTFAANTITASAGAEGNTCDVTVTVTTRASGSVDPAFGEGGRFDATQERSVTFRSTP
jgi:hypothetical protein